jgi:hypothetical protein
VRYSIEQYDKHGFLNAPGWLWLGWLFLAKAWIIFIMAGVSREAGGKILEFIYPVRETLYIGLGAGGPVILLMWLFGLRHPDRQWLVRLLRYGKHITALTTLFQLWLVGYQIYLDRGNFSWPNALTLVGLLWLLIFVLKSRRVQDCFRSPLLS